MDEAVLNKDGYVDLNSFVFLFMTLYSSPTQTFLMAHLYIRTYTYMAMKEVNKELFHVSSVSVFMQM